MTDFTRRTHVVRIYDTPPQAGQAPSSTYIDVEVLDAISYRLDNGKEAILDFAGGKINPYIVDNTGDGNGKSPDAAVATRRSHMKRITSPDGTAFFDAEILDCIAFRDENGREWIMDFPNEDGSVNEYNVTTGKGDKTSTRRVHNEKVSSNLSDPNPSQYLTSVRTDAIAFRTILGHEMILKMPSSDDPTSSEPRASTFMTSPKNYLPSDTDPNDAPPTNSDANVYAYMPPGGSFYTGATEIDMGPLWWIRNVNAGVGPIIRISGGIGLDGVASDATCSAAINGISIINETTPNGSGIVQPWIADTLANSAGSLFVTFNISDLGAWLKAKGGRLADNGTFTVSLQATGHTPLGGDGGNPVDGSGSFNVSASNDLSGQRFDDGGSVDTGNTFLSKPVAITKTENISLPNPPP